MTRPKVYVDKPIREKFKYRLLGHEFERLSKASGLDMVDVDELWLILGSTQNRLEAKKTNYGLSAPRQRNSDGRIVPATVIVFPERFVGYGQYGVSLVFGRGLNMSPAEIDNHNLSSVVLHELFHVAIRGGLDYSTLEIPELHPALDTMDGRDLSDNEKTVRYLTYQTMEKQPWLGQTLEISKA